MTPGITAHCSDRRIAGWFLAIVLLPGCTIIETPPQAQPAPPGRVSVAPDPHAEEIGLLLTEAELAMADNRLTSPVDDNAYLRYLRILNLDPESEEARRGIASIVERYLSWSLEAAEKGNLRRARRFLTSATAVDERHPGIESITARIDEIENSNQDRHAVPALEIARRSAAATTALQRIAVLAQERRALVIISARSDAEGRWMYQQMNAATPGRLRARLELASQPMIRMIY